MPISIETVLKLAMSRTHPALTDKEKLNAIRRNVKSFDYISNPTEEMELAAVEQDGLMIRRIQWPRKSVQLAAIHQNPLCFVYIQNPCPDARELHKKYTMLDILSREYN